MAGAVILIVVERAEHRATLNQSLRASPHRLVFALDGEDGFDRFREAKPDLVLAHVHAPRLDGTILCQLVRQEPGGSVPFLLLTDDPLDDARTRDRARAVGADGMVSLNGDRETLLEAISARLDGYRREKDTLRNDVRASSSDERSSLAPTGAIAAPPAGPAARTMLDFGPFESKTMLDLGTEENDDMPTSLTFAPGELLAGGDLVPAVVDPGESSGETTQGEITDTGAAVALLPALEPVPRLAVRPSTPAIAFPENTPEMWQPEAAARAQILEEPLLPIGAMGAARPLGEDGATRRIAQDSLIEELPRETTPSAEASAPRAPDPAEAPRKGGRLRKGLDESQLGKRLIKRVHHVYRLLDELDYYQLLGIEPEATPQQLKTAYFELSLEFHPDRFFLLRSGEVKEKIYAIYRRVTEAYGVLNDGKRRAAYDHALSETRAKRAIVELVAPPIPELQPSSTPRLDLSVQTPAARRFVQLSQTALEGDDLDGARLFVAFALGHEPQNGALRRSFEELSARRVSAQKTGAAGR